MESMQGYELKGRKLEINKHEKKSTRETKDGNFAPAKFNNLFIKNLPKGTDDVQLKDLFSKFGEIESV
jgi:RNA recognition motif-containing protein